jgi:hypothetical protein
MWLLTQLLMCSPRGAIGRYLVGGPVLFNRYARESRFCRHACATNAPRLPAGHTRPGPICADLYILGHGMDMVELHLWWLFVFRARTKISGNKCVAMSLHTNRTHHTHHTHTHTHARTHTHTHTRRAVPV